MERKNHRGKGWRNRVEGLHSEGLPVREKRRGSDDRNERKRRKEREMKNRIKQTGSQYLRIKIGRAFRILAEKRDGV